MATTRNGDGAAPCMYGRANAAASSSSATIARGEQQEVRNRRPERLFHRRSLQQPDGGERHVRRHVSLQQVQHDRDRDRQGADQERGIQERHACARTAVATSAGSAPTDKPAAPKSSGFVVSSCT